MVGRHKNFAHKAIKVIWHVQGICLHIIFLFYNNIRRVKHLNIYEFLIYLLDKNFQYCKKFISLRLDPEQILKPVLRIRFILIQIRNGSGMDPAPDWIRFRIESGSGMDPAPDPAWNKKIQLLFKFFSSFTQKNCLLLNNKGWSVFYQIRIWGRV